MRVVIEVESGSRKGGRWLLRTGDQMCFGRSEDADIMLTDDPMMSSNHFRLRVAADSCLVEDLRSTNGTWIDERRITSEEVGDGTKIRAGKTIFAISVEVQDPAFQTTWTNDQGAEDEISGVGTDVDQSIGPPSEVFEVVDEDGSSVFTDLPPASEQLQLLVRKGHSGILRAVQNSPFADPLAMLDILSSVCPFHFIIDPKRTGVVAESVIKDSSPEVFNRLDVLNPELVSPYIAQPRDYEERKEWLTKGWGGDGMIIVFTRIDEAPMLDHLQRTMHATKTDWNQHRQVLGLCWPSVLETWLSTGPSTPIERFLEPCEAIMLESPWVPSEWALLGDERMTKLLTGCLVPFSHEA